MELDTLMCCFYLVGQASICKGGLDYEVCVRSLGDSSARSGAIYRPSHASIKTGTERKGRSLMRFCLGGAVVLVEGFAK